MKKGWKLFSLISLGASLMLGVFSFGHVSEAHAAIEVDAEIGGVQVRSAGGEGNYIVIFDNAIVDEPTTKTKWNRESYACNEKIKIYTDKDTSVELGTIIADDWWIFNQWDKPIILFPLSSVTYATYNASSIYMIEILEGCTYPNNKGQTVVNHETLRYVNLNWHSGDTEKSFEWAQEKEYEPSGESIYMNCVQLRCDQSVGYYIVFCSDSYNDVPLDKYKYVNLTLNAFDEHIKIYLTEGDDFVYLEEITNNRSAVINKWAGTNGFMFNLTSSEFDAYNGSTVYRVDVLEGCEFILNDQIVTTSETVSMINSVYDAEIQPDGNYGRPSAKNEVACLPVPEDPHPEPLEDPIYIDTVQVRSEVTVEHEWYFISLLAYEAYVDNKELNTAKPEYEYDTSTLNCYDNIRVYTDENNFKTLGEVTSLRRGVQCRWDKNFMFYLDETEFNTYNGSSIYKIEIIKDCEVFVNYAVAKIAKTYSFINKAYGDASKRDNNLDQFEVTSLPCFGSVDINNIHNRMNTPDRGKPDCERWLMFMVDDAIFDTTKNANEWVSKLNFLSKVKIYLTKDGEPITLSSIYDGTRPTSIQTRKFGETNMLGVNISNAKEGSEYLYDGPHMYSLVIEEGAQIPSFEDGEQGYRLITDKTLLVNDEYGLHGPIEGTSDDEGDPRLYEEWNLFWSPVRCFVNFTVVGIEGLTFPEISLQKGQYVSLEQYEQSGYDLVATTDDGSTVYGSIVGVDHNLNITLTYTTADPNAKKKKSNSNIIVPIAIGGGSTLVAGAVVATVLIILKKKKGKVKNEE